VLTTAPNLLGWYVAGVGIGLHFPTQLQLSQECWQSSIKAHRVQLVQALDARRLTVGAVRLSRAEQDNLRESAG